LTDDCGVVCTHAISCLQRRGKIYLSWKDTSLCESGFVFDRAGSSFTPIYNFESPQVCFTQHSPSSIFDDLTTTPSIQLGSIQTYCVRAVNPVGYKFGYRSNPGCQDIKIAWESMVSSYEPYTRTSLTLAVGFWICALGKHGRQTSCQRGYR
jgi:hypothetical protein